VGRFTGGGGKRRDDPSRRERGTRDFFEHAGYQERFSNNLGEGTPRNKPARGLNFKAFVNGRWGPANGELGKRSSLAEGRTGSNLSERPELGVGRRLRGVGHREGAQKGIKKKILLQWP